MSSPRPLHRQAAQHFDECYKRKQSESFLSQQEHTIWVSRHRTLRINIYIWMFFFESSIKSLQVTKTFAICKVFVFVFVYLTHTKIDFLFKHLPTEIFISKNVCYQMKCFGGDSFFLFLEAGFANISSTFTISREVQTRYSKTLRYSQ